MDGIESRKDHRYHFLPDKCLCYFYDSDFYRFLRLHTFKGCVYFLALGWLLHILLIKCTSQFTLLTQVFVSFPVALLHERVDPDRTGHGLSHAQNLGGVQAIYRLQRQERNPLDFHTCSHSFLFFSFFGLLIKVLQHLNILVLHNNTIYMLVHSTIF